MLFQLVLSLKIFTKILCIFDFLTHLLVLWGKECPRLSHKERSKQCGLIILWQRKVRGDHKILTNKVEMAYDKIFSLAQCRCTQNMTKCAQEELRLIEWLIYRLSLPNFFNIIIISKSLISFCISLRSIAPKPIEELKGWLLQFSMAKRNGGSCPAFLDCLSLHFKGNSMYSMIAEPIVSLPETEINENCLLQPKFEFPDFMTGSSAHQPLSNCALHSIAPLVPITNQCSL